MRPDCRDLARPATYDKTKKIYFETENAAKATWGTQNADKSPLNLQKLHSRLPHKLSAVHKFANMVAECVPSDLRKLDPN